MEKIKSRLKMRKHGTLWGLGFFAAALILSMQNCSGVLNGKGEESFASSSGNGGSYGGGNGLNGLLHCQASKSSGNGSLSLTAVTDPSSQLVIQDTELATTEYYPVQEQNLGDGRIRFYGAGIELVLSADKKSSELEMQSNGAPVTYTMSCL